MPRASNVLMTVAYPAEDEAGVLVRFAPEERERAKAYFVQTQGRGHCPAGPAKKRYAMGHRLAETVGVGPLPAGLRVRMGEPPLGYRYVIVDGDLVKLAIGTSIVVDAVEGLMP